jgi:hypothetical protein
MAPIIRNNSNQLEQYRARNGTEPEQLQWFYNMKNPDIWFLSGFNQTTLSLED